MHAVQKSGLGVGGGVGASVGEGVGANVGGGVGASVGRGVGECVGSGGVTSPASGFFPLPPWSHLCERGAPSALLPQISRSCAKSAQVFFFLCRPFSSYIQVAFFFPLESIQYVGKSSIP